MNYGSLFVRVKACGSVFVNNFVMLLPIPREAPRSRSHFGIPFPILILFFLSVTSVRGNERAQFRAIMPTLNSIRSEIVAKLGWPAQKHSLQVNKTKQALDYYEGSTPLAGKKFAYEYFQIFGFYRWQEFTTNFDQAWVYCESFKDVAPRNVVGLDKRTEKHGKDEEIVSIINAIRRDAGIKWKSDYMEQPVSWVRARYTFEVYHATMSYLEKQIEWDYFPSLQCYRFRQRTPGKGKPWAYSDYSFEKLMANIAKADEEKIIEQIFKRNTTIKDSGIDSGKSPPTDNMRPKAMAPLSGR